MPLLNVRKDVFDARDHCVAPNISKVPVKVSFRDQVPYIKDQGQEGSCTAHAGTEHYELMVRLHPSELPTSVDRKKIRLSPQFLYAEERTMIGQFSEDAGADSRTIFRVLHQVGCCLEPEDAYKPSTEFVEPGVRAVKEAKSFRFDAYHRILDVETAKTVLQSGYTFTVGMPLFQQFQSEEAAETGKIAMPSGSSIGGHEMHVIGADDSKGCFEVQNSWGTGWGDKGYCWVPYAYLNQVMPQVDFWMGHFGHPW